MAHSSRNLTVDPADPVHEWPTEAVQTALEPGDLADWHRLAVEIDDDPWGRTARQVEEVLRYSRPDGVAVAMEGVVARARERALTAEREEVAAEVRDAITRTRLSRAGLAVSVGTSPSRLSTSAGGKVTPSAAFMVRLRRVVARTSSHDIGATQDTRASS